MQILKVAEIIQALVHHREEKGEFPERIQMSPEQFKAICDETRMLAFFMGVPVRIVSGQKEVVFNLSDQYPWQPYSPEEDDGTGSKNPA